MGFNNSGIIIASFDISFETKNERKFALRKGIHGILWRPH